MALDPRLILLIRLARLARARRLARESATGVSPPQGRTGAPGSAPAQQQRPGLLGGLARRAGTRVGARALSGILSRATGRPEAGPLAIGIGNVILRGLQGGPVAAAKAGAGPLVGRAVQGSLARAGAVPAAARFGGGAATAGLTGVLRGLETGSGARGFGTASGSLLGASIGSAIIPGLGTVLGSIAGGALGDLMGGAQSKTERRGDITQRSKTEWMTKLGLFKKPDSDLSPFEQMHPWKTLEAKRRNFINDLSQKLSGRPASAQLPKNVLQRLHELRYSDPTIRRLLDESEPEKVAEAKAKDPFRGFGRDWATDEWRPLLYAGGLIQALGTGTLLPFGHPTASINSHALDIAKTMHLSRDSLKDWLKEAAIKSGLTPEKLVRIADALMASGKLEMGLGKQHGSDRQRMLDWIRRGRPLNKSPGVNVGSGFYIYAPEEQRAILIRGLREIFGG